MDRDAYLGDHDVRDFLAWAEPLITGKCPLNHSWTSPKWGTRSFKTVCDAFKQYEWKFSVTLPGHSQSSRGSYYKETVDVLNALRQKLEESEAQDDADGFREAAIAILQWGRVRHRNEAWLRGLGEEIIPRLNANARLLDPADADLDRLGAVDRMNSGFSKIYSLRVDGLPIYDSRVACALASLVRWYCQDKELNTTPETLLFGVPPGNAGVKRDRSCEHFRFRKVRHPGTTRYAQSNVKAAWLLGKLAKHPPFSAERDPLHALQSAMFMVGYAPLARPCERCPSEG